MLANVTTPLLGVVATAAIGRLGDSAITMVGVFFLDGLANAAEQLRGRAFGARDRTAFGRAVKLIVIWGFIFGAAATVLFTLVGTQLIDLMTASIDVRELAYLYRWLAALAPLCGVMAFCFDGIYIGAT